MYNTFEESYDDLLKMYGMPRRSGRYPWGSGEEPYQHGVRPFKERVDKLKRQGLSENDIAKAFDLYDSSGKPSTTMLRSLISIEKNDTRLLEVQKAESLKEKGLSLNAIAKEMGFKNDSSVRALLDPVRKEKSLQSLKTAEFLKERMKDTGKFLDVGLGVDTSLNISQRMLDEALTRLSEFDGYHVYSGRYAQVNNTNRKTIMKILAPEDAKHSDIFNPANVTTVKEYISRDGGKTYEKKFHYPESLNSKRLEIKYAEDGGINKDGVIELRRGKEDLSLGNSHYAQVRILVDGTHYLKGMAVYSDNLPPGIDVRFNTNKPKGTPANKVLKKIKDDPDNPFGSLIKDAEEGGQYWYTDSKGNKKLGLINKARDEGDWSKWSNKLPSQFLSKQPLALAQKQLKLSIEAKQNEFDSIMAITNPTVKKKLLDDFAETCDSNAVKLHATSLPGQRYHTILPINSLRDTEVYAPNYDNGTQIALIRFPHGGRFEIPILTVNNNNKEAINTIGKRSIDAVGITKNVADRLSGADFDGDTVMTIPTGKGFNIRNMKQLDGLKDYDPKVEYGTIERDGNYYNKYGKKVSIMKDTQKQMGVISNLITDMTIKNAGVDELARAVRHSMTVIDAEKHKLDWKTSYIENGIEQLKATYQKKTTADGRQTYGGASTILSRAKGETQIPKTQGQPKVNIKGTKHYNPDLPEGALIYKKSDNLYYAEFKKDKKNNTMTYTTTDGKKITYSLDDANARSKYQAVGKVDPITGQVYHTSKDGTIRYRTKMRIETSTRMAEALDAMDLVSDYKAPMEIVYANYANRLKRFANEARKESVLTKDIPLNRNAASKYANEVKSLERGLAEVAKNKPKERMANAIATSEVTAKKKAHPDMDKDTEKKLATQAINKAREKLGAKRYTIDVSEKEWEAIQAGAISSTKLKTILLNADPDKIRDYATPKQYKVLSPAMTSKVKAMAAKGYTNQQIANQLGISPSTVSKYV